jgi:coenzyme F420-reducing hydrogenase delta subunit/ferredoxin
VFPTAVTEPSTPRRGARLVHTIERLLDRSFGTSANPLRQLGAIGFHLFWVVAASGAYVYAFYDTGADGAWASLQALEQQQRWAGGLMRSVHRYASDAFVAVAVLHLAREWLLGRYNGFRWFTWVSGVPLLWLAVACGVVGFWLAWDRLAAWVAVAALEWLAVLPGLGGALVRNVVVPENVSDRLFSLLIFLHIGLSLLLLLGMWIHVQRFAGAVTRPHRATGAALLATLLALSVVLPAPLDQPADVSHVGAGLAVDWFYLAALPPGAAMPAATWAAAVGATLLLLALPWLSRTPRAAPARVDLANCNGCGRCFADCPYGAVIMVPRRDGRAHRVQARVDDDLCAGCGICTGSCPSATPFRSAGPLVSGIDLPQRPVQRLRAEVTETLGGLSGPARTLVIACSRGADARGLQAPDTGLLVLTCIGQLPPAFVDYALRNGADGVVVAGCAECDCEFRSGAAWIRERLLGMREPQLRAAVDRRRLALLPASRGDESALAGQVAAFRRSLRDVPALHDVSRRGDVPGVDDDGL